MVRNGWGIVLPSYPYFGADVKNGIQDLEKIIHYCELEIKKMKDMVKKN